MGNSVRGQMPSHTWEILAEQFNKKSDIEYNYESMMNIAKLEMDVFNAMAETQHYKKKLQMVSAMDMNDKFHILDKTLKLYGSLYDYLKKDEFLVDSEKLNEANQVTNVEGSEVKYDPMNDINCDIMLLDIVYGRKQCEYAQSLMIRSNEIMKKSPNEASAADVIYEIYKSETNGLVDRLRAETITEVKPSQSAYNTWHNWSVI